MYAKVMSSSKNSRFGGELNSEGFFLEGTTPPFFIFLITTDSWVITQLLTSLPQHKKVQLRLPPFVEVVGLIWAKCWLSPFYFCTVDIH
jgi:hypothetical protein